VYHKWNKTEIAIRNTVQDKKSLNEISTSLIFSSVENCPFPSITITATQRAL